jgi:MSHA biogenesis protein MshQ
MNELIHGRVGTHAVRFEPLRPQNVTGSHTAPLPIPIEAQHWNGAAFVRNTADNCTSVSAANVALGNFQGNLTAGHTSASVGGAFSAGLGSLTLSAPGGANRGSVDVSVNLGAAGAGATCVPGLPASTPGHRACPQGAWCGAAFDRDPTARATFGVLRAPDSVIFRTENF